MRKLLLGGAAVLALSLVCLTPNTSRASWLSEYLHSQVVVPAYGPYYYNYYPAYYGDYYPAYYGPAYSYPAYYGGVYVYPRYHYGHGPYRARYFHGYAGHRGEWDHGHHHRR